MMMKVFCWRSRDSLEGRTQPMEGKAAAIWMETMRRTSADFEYWLEDVPESGPVVHLNASDVQDALAAMIAAKRALEAAFAKPVLIVDLMRVIDRLEVY